MWHYNHTNELNHAGVMGMRWGHRSGPGRDVSRHVQKRVEKKKEKENSDDRQRGILPPAPSGSRAQQKWDKKHIKVSAKADLKTQEWVDKHLVPALTEKYSYANLADPKNQKVLDAYMDDFVKVYTSMYDTQVVTMIGSARPNK